MDDIWKAIGDGNLERVKHLIEVERINVDIKNRVNKLNK